MIPSQNINVILLDYVFENNILLLNELTYIPYKMIGSQNINAILLDYVLENDITLLNELTYIPTK